MDIADKMSSARKSRVDESDDDYSNSEDEKRYKRRQQIVKSTSRRTSSSNRGRSKHSDDESSDEDVVSRRKYHGNSKSKSYSRERDDYSDDSNDDDRRYNNKNRRDHSTANKYKTSSRRYEDDSEEDDPIVTRVRKSSLPSENSLPKNSTQLQSERSFNPRLSHSGSITENKNTTKHSQSTNAWANDESNNKENYDPYHGKKQYSTHTNKYDDSHEITTLKDDRVTAIDTDKKKTGLEKNPSLRFDSNTPRKTGRYDENDESTQRDDYSSDAETKDIIKDVDIPARRERTIQNRSTSAVPFVMQAHENGGHTDLVQCVIVREKGTVQSKLYPTYRMFLEDKNKLLLLARKMSYNRTANYHVFDMTRGVAGSKLSKKSGNYIGKLRAGDSTGTEYTLLTKSESREELAAIMFERCGLIDQFKDGCQPRKMTVLLPQLNINSEPIPYKVDSQEFSQKRPSMIDLLRLSETERMFLLTSKDPVFENGNYRLNFHGRVSIASVKNFQLSSPDDPGHIICQFGKVGEDKFHLDFKAPLNAMQAFALALCHFNI